MKDQQISEIERCEKQRCIALVAGDYAALAALLTDDLVHIHANGLCEGKSDYLEGVSTRLDFLIVDRPSITVREYGDIAVAIGPLSQTVRVKGPDVTVEMTAMLTQVWRRSSGSWKLCSFQATKVE